MVAVRRPCHVDRQPKAAKPILIEEDEALGRLPQSLAPKSAGVFLLEFFIVHGQHYTPASELPQTGDALPGGMKPCVRQNEIRLVYSLTEILALVGNRSGQFRSHISGDLRLIYVFGSNDVWVHLYAVLCRYEVQCLHVRRMRRSVAGFDFKEEHSHFGHARQGTPDGRRKLPGQDGSASAPS